jgi:tetratricopeptide (TPR) repeat protein
MTRDTLGEAGPVYLNSAGRPLARFSGPLPATAEGGDSPRLGREPALWRTHDRAARYRAVWLLGEKSDYAPLAQHLGQSPDWRLAAADATGVLFLREPRVEIFPTEPAQQMAREMWGGANRSEFLARTALSCLAAGAQTEAGELSQSAVRNSDRSAQAAAARARVLDVLGDLRGAIEESARATKLDPTLAEAWQVRAEALLQSGRADEAYAAAQKAVELAPGDPGARWLAARTANAARAFQSEALILEELIAQTRGRGGDDGFYQLFLGQSYARQGLARPALRALEKAAAAPGVTAEQRAMIEEEIAAVKGAEK